MDDLISRQAAIDALDFEIVHMTAYCDGKNEGNPLAQYNKGLEDGKKAIEALPSAQPERKKGKWIYGEDEYGIDGYHCDKCGFFVPWDYAHKFINYIEDYNFCPNCGAKMDEEEENTHD